MIISLKLMRNLKMKNNNENKIEKAGDIVRNNYNNKSPEKIKALGALVREDVHNKNVKKAWIKGIITGGLGVTLAGLIAAGSYFGIVKPNLEGRKLYFELAGKDKIELMQNFYTLKEIELQKGEKKHELEKINLDIMLWSELKEKLPEVGDAIEKGQNEKDFRFLLFSRYGDLSMFKDSEFQYPRPLSDIVVKIVKNKDKIVAEKEAEIKKYNEMWFNKRYNDTLAKLGGKEKLEEVKKEYWRLLEYGEKRADKKKIKEITENINEELVILDNVEGNLQKYDKKLMSKDFNLADLLEMNKHMQEFLFCEKRISMYRMMYDYECLVPLLNIQSGDKNKILKNKKKELKKTAKQCVEKYIKLDREIRNIPHNYGEDLTEKEREKIRNDFKEYFHSVGRDDLYSKAKNLREMYILKIAQKKKRLVEKASNSCTDYIRTASKIKTKDSKEAINTERTMLTDYYNLYKNGWDCINIRISDKNDNNDTIEKHPNIKEAAMNKLGYTHSEGKK